MYTNIILYVVFKQIRYISYGILLFDARHYFVKVQRCQQAVHLRGMIAVLLVKIIAATALRKKRSVQVRLGGKRCRVGAGVAALPLAHRLK